MTRFMAPRYFTQEQNDAVVQALTELGIGDDEGVRIFIIALEYELVEYGKSLPAPTSEIPPSEPVTQPILPELAQLAREITVVVEGLSQLPDNSRRSLLERLSAQDPFARPHDQAYLDAVTTELTRIALICQQQQQPLTTDVVLREDEKQLIGAVAGAYFECFESLPAADGGEPFTSLLQRIVEISDLPIVLDKRELEPILAEIG